MLRSTTLCGLPIEPRRTWTKTWTNERSLGHSVEGLLSECSKVCSGSIAALSVRYWTGCSRPIPLKNSISANARKILAARRRQACVDVGGHKEELPSPRTLSWQAYKRETDGICACSHIRAKLVVFRISSFSTESTGQRRWRTSASMRAFVKAPANSDVSMAH